MTLASADSTRFHSHENFGKNELLAKMLLWAGRERPTSRPGILARGAYRDLVVTPSNLHETTD